jgi:hypothetical protein
MPEHVLMSEIEIITDGGRRRRWSPAKKLRIVEETLTVEGTIPLSRTAMALRPISCIVGVAWQFIAPGKTSLHHPAACKPALHNVSLCS